MTARTGATGHDLEIRIPVFGTDHAPGRRENGMTIRRKSHPVVALCSIIAAVSTTVVTVIAGDIPLNERRSSYDLLSPETKAMQDEDTDNPGMLWVLEGETAWG